CYNEVTVGAQYASTKFKAYLFGLNCFVLPDLPVFPNNDQQVIAPENLQSIPKLLRRRSKTDYQNSLEVVKQFQTHLPAFSLFFFSKPSATSQEFIVNQLIKAISLASLVEKNENLDELSLTHGLPELFDSDYGLSFEGLRFLLLPSQESHPSLKPSEYQKINRDILSLLSAYLYSQEICYDMIIKHFVDIHSRKHNNIGDHSTYALDLSPYIMMLYLKHLIRFKQLRGLKSQEERNMTTTLEKASLLEYFANNSEVYQNNYLAQGLFIMGVYISEIERKQRDKGIRKTAISKLNLRGIPVQKVKSVMAVIDDLREVWDVYNDTITDAYYRECMNKLVSSSFSPEEIVFHILSGRAYNSYVGLMEFKKQQANKDSQEAQND
ncbi:MAG TPA: TM1802 family CRISPR-associated protein, partial [Candidatus Cloacimonadota bacterium]|nr:TM1802 family CRISPR-associated protein [Candidatus Cloacimonadota bacterium]